MKKTQTIKKKRLPISMIAARRQNRAEKEILPSYSAKRKGSQDTTQYQKYANPVHRALYGQAIKLKQTLFTH
jgi:hypothetical protein